MKSCSKCGKENEFYPTQTSYCKECQKEYSKKYKKDHPKETREQRRKYNLEHPNKHWKKHKARYVEDGRKRDSDRKYRKSHPNKVRIRRRNKLRRDREGVRDFYCKMLIKRIFGVKAMEITQEMIEVKRVQIMMYRQRKEIRKEIMENAG